MKSKIILTGLFLTTAISCSNFRPVVLTNAYLDPETVTEVNFEDINWSYALFNQYGTGLSYDLKLDYSSFNFNLVFESISVFIGGVQYKFQDWDTVGSTQAVATNISSVWRQRFNQALFSRNFDRTTKKAETNDRIQLTRFPNVGSLNFVITMKSIISYRVNVGSVFQAFNSFKGASIDQYAKYMRFYNNNNLLQTFLLDTDTTGVTRNYVYGLSTIITNVNNFDLFYQWVDIPPDETTQFSVISIYEFNVFTQNQEISIPDDVSGNTFGFEFVAVEWWDILGHLQNFAWWVVNKSPIAPVFEWIDTYVITWISGLITFITGVFNL